MYSWRKNEMDPPTDPVGLRILRSFGFSRKSIHVVIIIGGIVTLFFVVKGLLKIIILPIDLSDLSKIKVFESWHIPGDLLAASIFGFSFYRSFRHYYGGNRRLTTLLASGMLLLYASLITILFTDSGLPDPEYTYQFISVTAIGVIAIVFVSDFIRTKDRQQSSQEKLEALTRQWTAELSRTNKQMNTRINALEETTDILRRKESDARALLDTSPVTAILTDLNGLILDINQNGAKQLGLRVDRAKGKVLFDILEYDQAETLKGRVTELMISDRPVYWEERRFGRYFACQLHPIRDSHGSLIRISQSMEDVTNRVSIESNLHQHVEDLDILNRVIDLITDAKDLTTVLLSASEMIAERFHAWSVYILVDSEEDNCGILQGFDCVKGQIGPFPADKWPRGKGFSGRDPFIQNKPMIVSDPRSPMIPFELRDRMVRANSKNAILFPLRAHGEMKGLVAICRRSTLNQFSPEDSKFAERVVSHLARAIENMSIVETVREKAIREERDRLARDMHDSVTQTIYSANLITEVLPSIWDRNPEEGKRDLLKVRQLVRGSLAEMRTMLFELRPSALEMASLETLIRQLGFVLSGRARIPVQITVDGDTPVPASVKTTIYHIVQEIFNNIAKHSEATQVQATLKVRPDSLTVDIADNGKGFNPSSGRSKGMGMRIMQERAALIGAEIQVISEPEQGTNIKLSWRSERTEEGNGD